MRALIPTNIITGFLGSGKTTAILDMLRRKPADEKWAVLVNEFGEIGIDGKILSSSGAEIREVAGGCMCCVGNLPMHVALNNLIAKVRPDRLLVEPSGLGHPQEIIDTLSGEQYAEVLELRAVICLIDPRKLRDERYLNHPIFNDQLKVADIIVANKMDICGESERELLEHFVARLPAQPQQLGWTQQGQLALEWLDRARAAAAIPVQMAMTQDNLLLSKPDMPLPIFLMPGTEFARREHRGDDFFSCGWLFADTIQFDFLRLMSLMSGLNMRRLKAVMQTERGNFVFNADDGVLSVNEITGNVDSVIECIADTDIDWLAFERQLLAARQ
ncbi:MAG: GTP-binding protein [Spongiibacteraceae bacterium]